MKMQKSYPFFLFAVLAMVLGLIPINNVVAAELMAPQAAIEKVSNELKVKLQDETFITDFQKINTFVDKTINPHVDFNRISALVLGKLWRKATKEEKKRFSEEFKTLLIRTYARAFLGFKDWTVRFLPLKVKQGAKKIIVKTEIIQPGNQPLSVNYRMLLRKGHWKVYDIMIEGVSLVTNYRSSIKNEFRKTGSLTAVIDSLAKRNSSALAKKQKAS